MDHTQTGETPLPTAVNPLWVPPITPYCVLLLGHSLRISRFCDGVETKNTVYEWKSTLGENDWSDTLTNVQIRLLASGRPERLQRWMLQTPFRSVAERLDPWASRLGKQDIRLFAMQLDDKDTITGTLLTFERSRCPWYTALSYVCGQGSCDQEIYVNGGRLCVKPNLLAALEQFKSCMIQRLREDAISSAPPRDMFCWVWVDAMSINQEDVTEKAEQIGEMHHVYREASRTAVCLGHFGSDLGCVVPIFRWAMGVRQPAESGRRRWTQFELVEQLRDFGVSPGNLRAIFDNMRHAPTRWSKDEHLGFEESSVAPNPMQKNPTFFEKMFDIIEQEWFSRVWTYQEYYLAATREGGISLEYLLGDHAIPWYTFMDISLAVLSPHAPLGTHQCISENRIARNTNRMAVEFPLLKGTSLWTLLEASCQRRAAVASDHVFAIVGLMEPEMRSRVLVDYSRSDASIFTDAFEHAINHEGDGLRLTLC